jgi:predicted nuclease of predicted toxin-antitoxin system
MRFLIDECLTIDLVSIARRTGHEAHHLAHVGKAGWKDWNVARHAREGDFVIIIPNVINRGMQQRLFRGGRSTKPFAMA